MGHSTQTSNIAMAWRPPSARAWQHMANGNTLRVTMHAILQPFVAHHTPYDNMRQMEILLHCCSEHTTMPRAHTTRAHACIYHPAPAEPRLWGALLTSAHMLAAPHTRVWLTQCPTHTNKAIIRAAVVHLRHQDCTAAQTGLHTSTTRQPKQVNR